MNIVSAMPVLAKYLTQNLQPLLLTTTALTAFATLPAMAAAAPNGPSPIAAAGQPAATPPGPAAPKTFKWQVGDLHISLSGQTSLGTDVRTSGINPNYIPGANAKALGFAGYAAGGANSDDGDLNWADGRPTSTVAKTFIDLDIHTGNVGVFLRGKAWYDYTLSTQSVPWGSVIGGYQTGKPLSQAGMNPLARFGGASLQEAYAYGTTDLGPVNVEGRVGNIVVPWGLPTMIPGGLLFNVNAIDAAAYYRPGSVPQEWLLPTPGTYLKASLTKNLSIDGFMYFKSPQDVLAPCGAFTTAADWAAQGCNTVVFVPSFSAPTSISTGEVLDRGAAPANYDPQYGAGASYMVDPLATKFGLYYAHVDSPQLYGSLIKATYSGALKPNTAGNAQYFTDNVPGVESFAINFQTLLRATHTMLYGEYVYHPNMPVGYTASDLVTEAVGGSGILAAPYNAVAPGGTFLGYDRLRVGSLDLGFRQALPPILGATAFLTNGEVALKEVYDLPNVNDTRFVRSDTFGTGPVNGTCKTAVGETASTIALQCSNNGYVTPIAVTYRLAATLRYDNVLMHGLSVSPTVGISQDVYGWSYDGGIIQGQMNLNLHLRAVLDQRYFLDLVYNPALKVAAYNATGDRQFASAVIGINF